MMKKRLSLLAAGIMALSLMPPIACLAEEAGASKLDAMFNDEAVKALLDEANPDAAFITRIKMMRAHLSASADLNKKGETAEALQHIKHPRSEIYPEIEATLIERNMREMGNLLDALEKAFEAGEADSIKSALSAVNSELDKADALIAPAALASGKIQSESASLLLRAAVVEYHRAFEFSKLTNMVEYHDGAFFVTEARKLLEQAEPVFAKRDPESLAKLKESFSKLEKAWPAEAPPAELVMPVTRMQSLVSIMELQLARLQ